MIYLHIYAFCKLTLWFKCLPPLKSTNTALFYVLMNDQTLKMPLQPSIVSISVRWPIQLILFDIFFLKISQVFHLLTYSPRSIWFELIFLPIQKLAGTSLRFSWLIFKIVIILTILCKTLTLSFELFLHFLVLSEFLERIHVLSNWTPKLW